MRPHAPYAPPRLPSDIVYAIKAIASGTAKQDQQQAFFEWLIIEACKKEDMPWFPGDLEADRDTSFANGKRFVAISVLKGLNMSPEDVASLRLNEQAMQGLPITEGDEVGSE